MMSIQSHLLSLDSCAARDGQNEAGARGIARHGYRAAMQLRDTLHQIEPKPSARFVLRPPAAEVFLEDPWHLIRRNAAASVRDREVNSSVCPSLRMEPHRGPRGGMAHGIRQ